MHLAEVGTTLVAGASHWRFGNVDWRLVLRLGVPGAVGAFLGATVLSALSTENAAPHLAGVLLALGRYVLSTFSIRPPRVAHVGAADGRPDLSHFAELLSTSQGCGLCEVTSGSARSAVRPRLTPGRLRAGSAAGPAPRRR